MKLIQVILKNFRLYKDETRISVAPLTTLLGRNDAGKSSVLEALEIFFNQEVVALEHEDIPANSESKEIRIGCVFGDVADAELVIDETAKTTLRQEYMLNSDGDLEIVKVFDCSGSKIKESVFAIALHPRNDGMNDLLLLKNNELKKRLEKLGVGEGGVDKRSNPSIRSAIWGSADPLRRDRAEIPLDKEDAKKIWEQLRRQLPIFALFRADRPSRDEDSEVQDPMKIAIQEALRSIGDQLEAIKESVRQKANSVAERTLEKLNEFAPDLANQLSPDFRADPKWEQLFKLSLRDERGIPINKRGSGARRLILLSFLRATAEQRQVEQNSPSLIYGIEEPETSQHPSQQRNLVEAFLQLADRNCQIILTTHNPALASLVPVEGIQYLHTDGDTTVVSAGSAILAKAAKELGVIPDHQIKVLVCVEGPNDIAFLRHISRVLNRRNPQVPSLADDPRIAFFPLGGSNLKQWVQEQHLRGLNRPEIHLYDRGVDNPPKYRREVEAINGRGDGSYAVLTGRRELENYLHPEAIREECEVEVRFGDDDSVPEIVAAAIHNSAPDRACSWGELDEERKREKIKHAKKRLNDGAAARMTYERLQQSDPAGELEAWLRRIGELCNGA